MCCTIRSGHLNDTLSNSPYHLVPWDRLHPHCHGYTVASLIHNIPEPPHLDTQASKETLWTGLQLCPPCGIVIYGLYSKYSFINILKSGHVPLHFHTVCCSFCFILCLKSLYDFRSRRFKASGTHLRLSGHFTTNSTGLCPQVCSTTVPSPSMPSPPSVLAGV